MVGSEALEVDQLIFEEIMEKLSTKIRILVREQPISSRFIEVYVKELSGEDVLCMEFLLKLVSGRRNQTTTEATFGIHLSGQRRNR